MGFPTIFHYSPVRSLIQGGPFHNFSSWTQKWKIYIDIFYGVSYNIKHITAISNLHFQ